MATATHTINSSSSLIAAHIAARHEHDRIFDLSDWGMAPEEDATKAADAIDDALLAICRARPKSAEDATMRRKYILDYALEAVQGRPHFTLEVIEALLDSVDA